VQHGGRPLAASERVNISTQLLHLDKEKSEFEKSQADMAISNGNGTGNGACSEYTYMPGRLFKQP
jgi:hypothetical protein